MVEEQEEWEGLSEVILGRREWFERWLDGERECESSFFYSIRNRTKLIRLIR